MDGHQHPGSFIPKNLLPGSWNSELYGAFFCSLKIDLIKHQIQLTAQQFKKKNVCLEDDVPSQNKSDFAACILVFGRVSIIYDE